MMVEDKGATVPVVWQRCLKATFLDPIMRPGGATCQDHKETDLRSIWTSQEARRPTRSSQVALYEQCGIKWPARDSE